MKRLITIILAFLLTATTLPCNALATVPSSDTIIRFDDGSYIVIDLHVLDTRASSTRSSSKEYIYYSNSGEEAWRAELFGTFTYDGSTSVCTASSCTVTISKTSWYAVSKTVGKNGNTATADLVMGNKLLGITVLKREISLTLTCDANGNLS